MIIVLWFILYWKWLLLGAGIALAFHFYGIIREALNERKEEAEFREIPSEPVEQIALENEEHSKELVVVPEVIDIQEEEKDYIDEDEREASLRRGSPKVTGPPNTL